MTQDYQSDENSWSRAFILKPSKGCVNPINS